MVIRVQKKEKIMKKTYISPDMEVVKLAFDASVLQNYSNTQASSNPEILAPELPGISDDELFQFIMIH